MGDVITTMTVIVVANAILLPLAAYVCLRLGLLPGVGWYWPIQRYRDGTRPMVRVLGGRVIIRRNEAVALDGGEASAALELQAAARLGGDTLMESAEGKPYLIPFPLAPFEVRDQAEILELQRQIADWPRTT